MTIPNPWPYQHTIWHSIVICCFLCLDFPFFPKTIFLSVHYFPSSKQYIEQNSIAYHRLTTFISCIFMHAFFSLCMKAVSVIKTIILGICWRRTILWRPLSGYLNIPTKAGQKKRHKSYNFNDIPNNWGRVGWLQLCHSNINFFIFR